MAIDIKLNTDTDLGGIDKLADGLDDATKAAEKLDKKDTKKLDKSLGEAEKSADKLADGLDDAERATDKLGDSAKKIDKIEDEASEAAKAIDRDLTAALKDAATQAENTGQRSGDALKKGFDKGNEASEEVMGEMAQNWGSTMASFDGSAQSMVQIIADSFGGLAGSMAIGGPVGSLFLGAAAGLTALWAQNWFDQSSKVEERTAEMYSQMLDSANAYFGQTAIIERFHAQISGNKDEDASLLSKDDFDDVVEMSGLSKQTVALAVADPRSDAAAQLQKAMQASEDAQVAAKPDTSKAASASGYGVDSGLGAWVNRLDKIRETRETLNALNSDVESTSNSIKSNTEFLRENGYILDNAGAAARDFETAQVAAKTALDDAKAAISANNDALGGAAAATDENEAALSDMVDQLISVQTAMADTGAKTDEVTQLQKDQAEAFIQAGEAAGYQRDEAIDLAEHLGLIPHEVATQLKQTGAGQVQSDAQLTMDTLAKIPATKEIKTVLVPPMQQAVNEVLSVTRTMLGTMKIPVEPVTSRNAYPNG